MTEIEALRDEVAELRVELERLKGAIFPPQYSSLPPVEIHNGFPISEWAQDMRRRLGHYRVTVTNGDKSGDIR